MDAAMTSTAAVSVAEKTLSIYDGSSMPNDPKQLGERYRQLKTQLAQVRAELSSIKKEGRAALEEAMRENDQKKIEELKKQLGI